VIYIYLVAKYHLKFCKLSKTVEDAEMVHLGKN